MLLRPILPSNIYTIRVCNAFRHFPNSIILYLQNSVDGESGLLSFDAHGHRANLTLSLIGHSDGPKRHVGVWQATPPLFANRLQLHYSNHTELNGNAIGNRKARVVTIKVNTSAHLYNGILYFIYTIFEYEIRYFRFISDITPNSN